MKRRVRVFALTVCLLLSGCVRTDHAAFAPEEDARLTVFTCHEPSVYEPVIRARTGIWVAVESGTAEALTERIGDGGPDCDVLFGGSKAQAEAAGLGESWVPFSSRPLVLVYNTKLVRLNPPQDWGSLTAPAWKGKVAFPDPVSQEGLLALSMLVQTGGDLTALAENLDGRLPADSRQVVSAVAEGSFYIGIAPEETALTAIEAGLDIAIVTPSEGTAALTDGAALVPGCTHEENAQRFLAFLQGEDMQQMLSSELHRRPAQERFEALTESPADIFARWQALWKEDAH